MDDEIPEPPQLQKLLTIGFNTTTRYLDLLARRSAPRNTAGHDATPDQTTDSKAPAALLNPDNMKPLAAVFVPPLDQSSVLHSHLPILIRTASLARPSLSPTRLIMLPKGAEERLSAALSIPRLGLIGLIDDVGTIAYEFIEFIRQNVAEVEVPWIQNAAVGPYLPVNIKTIQSRTPANPKKGGRTQAVPTAIED